MADQSSADPGGVRAEFTLAEALPKECARVRTVLGYYGEIGPAGRFGAMMIERDLAAADKAMAEGDVVAMLRSYETLKKIED